MPESPRRHQRRHLLSFEQAGATYFITWRLHPAQHPLRAAERSLIESALRHFDGVRYHLAAFVIMDDHVHVLVRPIDGVSLSQLLHTWKSFTAHRLQRLFGRLGAIWQGNGFNTIMRDRRHFERTVRYILCNPQKRWPEETRYRWLWVAE